MLKTVGKLTIVRGENFSEQIKLRINGGYDPLDLSSASAIEVKFRNEAGTTLTLNLAGGVTRVGSGILGDLIVTMSQVQTAALQKGNGQNIEVTYTIDSVKTIVVLPQVLDVIAPAL